MLYVRFRHAAVFLLLYFDIHSCSINLAYQRRYTLEQFIIGFVHYAELYYVVEGGHYHQREEEQIKDPSNSQFSSFQFIHDRANTFFKINFEK